MSRISLLTSVLCLAAVSASAADELTLIKAGVLIDGTSSEPKRDQAILVRGRRIERVGDAATLTPPAGARRIDLSRATVLPGLIDSHTHLFLQGEDPVEGGYDAQLLSHGLALRAARATVSARRALEQGFTTIRDVETEGAGYGDVGIKEAVDKGYIPGPRIFCSTRGLSTTGGYPLEGYAPELTTLPKGVQIADGPVEARKAVREQLDHGADWIKVYMTHRSWAVNGALVSQPTFTVEELKAMVDEAHAWGKKVACHAYGGPGLRRALDGGCDSIEHGLDLDDASVAQMVKQGTWYCPTLSVYYGHWAAEGTPAGVRDRLRVAVHGPSFQRALKAGVKIVFGTDVGGFAWSEPMAQEFPRMVELGMTPRDALRAATSLPAAMLGMAGQIGSITPGAYADLIAVAGDPQKDISVLGHVGFVMKDGAVFKDELTR